ncbi:hypothetical protein [Arvimicrobium flavum]|uniref:hypothetical protein n=1 Tax=Arvimicrobium flavum TaxID=3393320 RepID=UPI00237AD402|nr:hypothetical protein [Mesorhizobium shangrilense]
MQLSLYLAKVLGVALVIMGAGILLRRRYFVPVFGAYGRERLLRTVMSVIELFAGLFLVFGHNVWSPTPAAIISLLGWIAVIEGALFLLLPDDAIESVLEAVNRPPLYLGGGAVVVLVGVYLAGFGFGWW